MKITIDIAKAVNYLHHLSPVVIHRDLKSLNVLLAEEVADEYDTPIAKVADFGLSTWVHDTGPRSGRILPIVSGNISLDGSRSNSIVSIQLTHRCVRIRDHFI
jgi:serine/threonine protein kinase